MDCLSIQMPANSSNAIAEQMAGAAHDDKKLRRALVGGGAAKAIAALFLCFLHTPGGVFARDEALSYAYYGILAAVAVFGAMEVAAGFWVSRDPERWRCKGRLVLWASVVPLVLVTGLGGFAVLK